MGSIRRLAVEVGCPACSRPNTLLVPEGCCGNEFVWHARCGGCGAWRWFNAREDEAFVRVVKETSARRGEPGGLSPEGTREAHASFESTLDPCGCGGRWRVAFELRDLPCLGCGGSLRGVALPLDRGLTVSVPALRTGA